MNLNLSQIKSITNGAVRITCEDNGYNFYRFTQEQQELYENRSRKAYSTSGVQMHFKTDSNTLLLDVNVEACSGRKYFAFDIFLNGEKFDNIKNFDEKQLPKNYKNCDCPLGDFSKMLDLGNGIKDVKIVFPCSAKAVIKKIELDDNSFIEPIKHKNKIICFGDSITQGYDTLYPSGKYATRLADFLDAEEFNKGVGGEVFFPELAFTKEDFEPEFISVAYGTNDWDFCEKDKFVEACNKFYENVCKNYPKSKIFAISPIWRKDCEEKRKLGEFAEVGETIKKAVAKYENVTFISAFDFVPKDENFFADLSLHPNYAGFEQYYINLKEEVAKTLK